MMYNRYLIKCRNCNTETSLISRNVSPIIILCKGCNDFVVVNGSVIYNVDGRYARKIFKNFDMESCGQIIGCDVKKQYPNSKMGIDKGDGRRPINEEDVQKIKEVLNNNEDYLSLMSGLF